MVCGIIWLYFYFILNSLYLNCMVLSGSEEIIKRCVGFLFIC